MNLRSAIGIGAVALALIGGGSALADTKDVIPPIEVTCRGEAITMFLQPGVVSQGTEGKDVV